MYSNDTKRKLQDIIRGAQIDWQKNNCTSAHNFLCRSFRTNTKVKKDFDRQTAIKKEQSELLKIFITNQNLWTLHPPPNNRFLTQGGEAEIYFLPEHQQVLKLNDAIYYANWLDFFNSILIHNLLFEETCYKLEGFIKIESGLQAVLKQTFIISDNPVDLNKVKAFLEYNGFKNTRRNDYYNKELGLILEDIHDENVIMNSGLMFFIDTVFYIDLH